MVMTKRLRKEKNIKPVFQLLIYPWTQSVNINLPSCRQYKSGLVSTLTPGRIILWYLGFTNFNDELEDAINNNEHILLIQDKKLRSKYFDYFDMSQIPDQYKQKSYYSEHKDVRHYLKDDLDESHVLKDPQTETRVMQIFDEDFSPALATHDELKQTPKTYIIIFEWDSFKDENLLYAQKLKQAGVEVEIDFYHSMFHGAAHQINPSLGLKTPNIILEKIVSFIKNNV